MPVTPRGGRPTRTPSMYYNKRRTWFDFGNGTKKNNASVVTRNNYVGFLQQNCESIKLQLLRCAVFVCPCYI